MKMIISHGIIEVYHSNDHKIGHFEYSTVWCKWHFRTVYAGLDEADLKMLYKYSKKLNKQTILGKIYKLLNI